MGCHNEREDKSIKVTPKLPCGFAKICSVRGEIMDVDEIGGPKGYYGVLFFTVESIDGRPIPKTRIEIVPFDIGIKEELITCRKAVKLTIWGYETFAARGIPIGVEKYVLPRQSRGWGVLHSFVVLKVSSSD
jgi:hypothetical protein